MARMSTRATTMFGSWTFSPKLSSATSPTRMPLKSTEAPCDRPVTGVSKMTCTDLRSAPALDPENQKTKPKAAATTQMVNRPIRAYLARVSIAILYECALSWL